MTAKTGVLRRIQAIDDEVFHRVFRRRGGGALRALMLLASRSADGPVLVVVLVGCLLAGGEQRMVAAEAALAFALELSVQQLLKHAFKRSRPCERLSGVAHLIPPPDRYSFPSGHTAAAFLTAALLGSVAPLLALPLFGWAFCVAYSRVYAGVHYPADVLAGILLGLGAAFAAQALL